MPQTLMSTFVNGVILLTSEDAMNNALKALALSEGSVVVQPVLWSLEPHCDLHFQASW